MALLVKIGTSKHHINIAFPTQIPNTLSLDPIVKAQYLEKGQVL
jgi:hypothetical protein